MPYGDSVRPRRGQVMIEPLHDKISAILHDPAVGRVKSTMRGRLVAVGDACDSELKVGLEVLFVPHGGTVLATGDEIEVLFPHGGTVLTTGDESERMVLPADQILGIVEP